VVPWEREKTVGAAMAKARDLVMLMHTRKFSTNSNMEAQLSVTL
jgi:hypothetical protein